MVGVEPIVAKRLTHVISAVMAVKAIMKQALQPSSSSSSSPLPAFQKSPITTIGIAVVNTQVRNVVVVVVVVVVVIIAKGKPCLTNPLLITKLWYTVCEWVVVVVVAINIRLNVIGVVVCVMRSILWKEPAGPAWGRKGSG